jgi:hypothetical protein
MSTDNRTEPLKPNDPASPPAIRGEKQVAGTEAAVPVGQPDTAADNEGVTEPIAVDHRKQFTGGDDHREAGGGS